MGLTIKEIENAKPHSNSYKLADGRGLCLLISPTGRNSGAGAIGSMARRR